VGLRGLYTQDVTTCVVDVSAAEAARVMADRDCGSVPVVDEDGRLCGIVTDRDLLLAARVRGTSLAQVRLLSLPLRPVETCRPDSEVEEVLATMAERRIRRLPVVERDGRLVGIVSLADLAADALGDEARMLAVARALAAIGVRGEPAPVA
jgi:CBS domain-containing protein